MKMFTKHHVILFCNFWKKHFVLTPKNSLHNVIEESFYHRLPFFISGIN